MVFQPNANIKKKTKNNHKSIIISSKLKCGPKKNKIVFKPFFSINIIRKNEYGFSAVKCRTARFQNNQIKFNDIHSSLFVSRATYCVRYCLCFSVSSLCETSLRLTEVSLCCLYYVNRLYRFPPKISILLLLLFVVFHFARKLPLIKTAFQAFSWTLESFV